MATNRKEIEEEKKNIEAAQREVNSALLQAELALLEVEAFRDGADFSDPSQAAYGQLLNEKAEEALEKVEEKKSAFRKGLTAIMRMMMG